MRANSMKYAKDPRVNVTHLRIASVGAVLAVLIALASIILSYNQRGMACTRFRRQTPKRRKIGAFSALTSDSERPVPGPRILRWLR